MKYLTQLLILSYLIGYGLTIQAQSTIPVAGNNAAGSGGSVSYTVGQVTYRTFSGTDGSVVQGVQQPFEISVITAVDNTEGIALEFKVYPNPTGGMITLTIKPFNNENLRYRIFDLNGILLRDKKVDNGSTGISIEKLNPSVYFLKVIKDNIEVKVFKIVKN